MRTISNYAQTLIAVEMFWIFSKFGSLNFGFPGFLGGSGGHDKVREADRKISSKDHLKLPSWCRVMTKNRNKFTTIKFATIKVERRD